LVIPFVGFLAVLCPVFVQLVTNEQLQSIRVCSLLTRIEVAVALEEERAAVVVL
jgi:hypothetical protein